MTDIKPTSEVLNLAADLIEERGWTYGRGWEGDGPLCLEGAIGAAAGLHGLDNIYALWACPAAKAVQSYLDNVLRVGEPLFRWNDSLRFGRNPDGTIEFRWVGGSPEAADEFASSRVIEVLRATAVIEAARESEHIEVSA